MSRSCAKWSGSAGPRNARGATFRAIFRRRSSSCWLLRTSRWGRRRETVVVLFADIVAFTRMAEDMAPEDVLALLRELHPRTTARFSQAAGRRPILGDGTMPRSAPGREAQRRCRRAEPRRDDARRARTLERRTQGKGRSPARYRHRCQLWAGRAWRCRQ